MRYLKYLNEEYMTGSGIQPIFVNPNNKELREAAGSEKECRFFVDVLNKNLYVWYYRMLHEEASEALYKEGIDNKYPYNGTKEVWGVAHLSGTKLRVSEAYVDSISREISNSKLKRNNFYKELEFVSRWMDNTLIDYITRYAKF